jgi:hypothetical protein
VLKFETTHCEVPNIFIAAMHTKKLFEVSGPNLEKNIFSAKDKFIGRELLLQDFTIRAGRGLVPFI